MAKVRKAEQDFDRQAYVGYMTAALHRVKKMPKLKDVLPSASNKQKTPTPQTWETMFAAAQQWDLVAR